MSLLAMKSFDGVDTVVWNRREMAVGIASNLLGPSQESELLVHRPLGGGSHRVRPTLKSWHAQRTTWRKSKARRRMMVRCGLWIDKEWWSSAVFVDIDARNWMRRIIEGVAKGTTKETCEWGLSTDNPSSLPRAYDTSENMNMVKDKVSCQWTYQAGSNTNRSRSLTDEDWKYLRWAVFMNIYLRGSSSLAL